jgi:hypothetical protein
MNNNDYLVLPATCRTVVPGFVGSSASGGSSSIKFYVFMHDLDSVIERFSDHQ